ncbi:tetraacyldisaccharide 4'-kinase [Kineobactrum sediminis]|uniref:Tetraacyldisaccharide 4'-kinase n=2 Tax=Kineobactrum sediminis TaxID=1905677 RepID=A0A2N5Y1C0_9GAMM|nr:tetraacyldisaccharide 4'-kinase [Kineobactrum sediminis]
MLVRAWYRQATWLWLLRPLELVFRVVVQLRRKAYRYGLATVYRPPIPLVIVGNITVGGTGKTPVVIALVEALQARGLRPGVVSRGYGAAPGARFPHQVSDRSDADQCGDEPLLIHRRTGAPTVVDPDRSAAVSTLLASAEIDLVLSDDGLQHYALARDFEIVLMDALRGTGNGFCLPAGPLREPLGRLAEVDYVLLRGSDDPIQGVRYDVQGLRPVRENDAGEQAAPLPGSAIHAVAGIGQPGQFFSTLEEAGFVVGKHSFADHHRYTEQDFAAFADRPIIMTEKDAVKCRSMAHAQMWYLKISARLPEPLVDAVAALVRSPA